MARLLATMRGDGRGVVICGHTHVPAIERRDRHPLPQSRVRESAGAYEVSRSVALLRIERGECAADNRRAQATCPCRDDVKMDVSLIDVESGLTNLQGEPCARTTDCTPSC